MTIMEQLVAKAGKENRAAEAKRPAPTKEQVATEYAFLKKWARGKPIVRQSADSTFWQKGKFMTKIDYKMADALVAAGYATLRGNAKEAGATLMMIK
jgi:hypothetical protein